MENSKLVDIIIPVHNRLEHTRQTIDSLLKNTDSSLYNLYLVDDKSDEPGVKEYIQSMSEFFPVFFNTENIGPGASRNWVANWITEKGFRSKYIYHSDNDVFFTEGWLEKLLAVFEHCYKEVKVLGGGCHPYLQSTESIPVADLPFRVGHKDAVSGYSQLMTWETWDKYGPFDESMRGAEKKIMGSEDWAFCQKIVKDGFKVGSIEPEVVIATGKTNTYGDLATGSETFTDREGVMVK